MTGNRLQLSDIDPRTGLQLSLALGWYGDQFFAQKYPSHQMVDLVEQGAAYSVRHNLQPDDLSYVDPAGLPGLRRRANVRQRALLDDIGAQLRAGKLYATGFRVGEHESITIPRQWWTVATLTPETNSAEGNGVTFSGLLIFETADQQLTLSASGASAIAWMKEKVTAPGQWKSENAFRACMTATGATYREAKSAWATLPDDIRGRRGARK